MGNSETDAGTLQPVGQGRCVARAGDCVESIAYANGFFWETIWEHPDNAELKEARKNPNILVPGDRVAIPRQRREDDCQPVDQRHRYRRRGVPSRLRLRILSDGKPRAGQPFRLDIDGTPVTGQTDPDGRIDVPIPPHARRGELTVGPPDDQERHELELGHIVPVSDIAGVQQRLSNLGFSCPVDGAIGPDTEAAISDFQVKHELEETGQADAATLAKLEELHGS